MKKVLSCIMTTVLLVASPLNIFAASTPELFPGTTEIVTSEYSQFESTAYSCYDLKPQDVIIHNYGKAIESDYFVEGKSEGNKLIAVKYENTEYGMIENVYFANVESVSIDNLVEMVSAPISISELEKINTVQAKSSVDSDIKKYNWEFYSSNIFGTQFLQATLTTTITPVKQSANSTINGKSCSVWDVTSFSQLEKKECIRLNNQYTRLSVDLDNQELLSYGPIGSTSGGDVTVNLGEGGVPSLSYTFNIDGFSVTDLSSMADNYGRWAFIDNVGNEASFTTQPGIRATNTTGNFIVELSHTVELEPNAGSYREHGTGVIQIYLSDR